MLEIGQNLKEVLESFAFTLAFLGFFYIVFEN
jgi:hypothetical protein